MNEATYEVVVATPEQIRLQICEHRLDEIERAVIAMYKRTFVDGSIPEMAPLLARMKEVKMELTQG